jgi:cbb3-type cytochrome oxidase subunit 3
VKTTVQNVAMADTAYLASTVVMGLLGVGVVVLALRVRQWRQYVPAVASGDLAAGDGRPTSGLARLAGTTGTWTVLYVVTVLAFLGGVMVYSSGAASGTVVIGGLGVLIALYMVAGVYFALREHGRPYSQATAGSAVTLGALAIAAIVLKLVLGI